MSRFKRVSLRFNGDFISLIDQSVSEVASASDGDGDGDVGGDAALGLEFDERPRDGTTLVLNPRHDFLRSMTSVFEMGYAFSEKWDSNIALTPLLTPKIQLPP